MKYTVRPAGDEFEIVDEDGKVVGKRSSRDAAENRAEALEDRDEAREHRQDTTSRLDRMEQRIPKTQLTAEEKAAEYDRMMSEREESEKASKASKPEPEPESEPEPEAPARKTPAPSAATAKRRSSWWPDREAG